MFALHLTAGGQTSLRVTEAFLCTTGNCKPSFANRKKSSFEQYFKVYYTMLIEILYQTWSHFSRTFGARQLINNVNSLTKNVSHGPFCMVGELLRMALTNFFTLIVSM